MNQARKEFTRVNFHIKSPVVRVVKNGEQLGVMAIDKARRLAQDEELDLVEIAPQANPPVCGIMDFGKFKYEQKIKDKESKRNARESQVELKEIRLRPGIDSGDVTTKINQAKTFLLEGKRVQFNLVFKGYREMSHKDQGFEVMKRIVAELEPEGKVTSQPKMEGNRLTCRMEPK